MKIRFLIVLLLAVMEEMSSSWLYRIVGKMRLGKLPNDCAYQFRTRNQFSLHAPSLPGHCRSVSAQPVALLRKIKLR